VWWLLIWCLLVCVLVVFVCCLGCVVFIEGFLGCDW